MTFRKHLFDEITIEALMHGNWLTEHAKQFSQLLKSTFNQHYSNKHTVKIPVLDIQNQGEIHLPLQLPEHDHAAVGLLSFRRKRLNYGGKKHDHQPSTIAVVFSRNAYGKAIWLFSGCRLHSY